MARGILYVESQPASPEEADAFDTWYEHTHMKEMLGIEGVGSARRLSPLAGGGGVVAIYELDGDLDAVRARVSEAHRTGRLSPQVGMQLDPPPVVRYLGEIARLP